MEEKTLEDLSREAAEFLDEKPSQRRFFHFSLLVFPLAFSDLRSFSFHFDQVCQHLSRDHHGFGSIHLWILLLDRQ